MCIYTHASFNARQPPSLANPNLVLISLIGSLLFISWCIFPLIPTVPSSACPEVLELVELLLKQTFLFIRRVFLLLERTDCLYDLWTMKAHSKLVNSQSNCNFLLALVHFLAYVSWILPLSEQVGEITLKMKTLFPFTN